jgi:hypothetical protein
MEPEDKFMKALRRVVEDWDIFNLFLVVIFLPYSLFYIAFRIVQEWDKVD